jgi:hypothetical protein
MPHSPTLFRNSNALLRQVLEEPELCRWVRELRGPEWRALVHEVGLEDASELLALSTPEQLVELLDESMWRGETTDSFDPERFATLLEVLHEAGVTAFAERVAALPEEFLLLSFSRLVSVWPSEFLRQLSEADESGVLDKKLDAQMFEDFDEYTVLSPSGLAWDQLVTLLSTWRESHTVLFERLLSRLAATNVGSLGEPDELVNVLDEMAELEEEAQGEREERRARAGYVSKTDAHAFLRLPPVKKPGEKDAISAAYFRRLAPSPVHRPLGSGNRLLEIMRGQSRTAAPAAPKLTTGSGLLKKALDRLAQDSKEKHARVMEELAFLTNVLLSTLDRQNLEAGTDVTGVILSVVQGVETSGVGLAELDESAAQEKLLEALKLWGPIALFRNRAR